MATRGKRRRRVTFGRRPSGRVMRSSVYVSPYRLNNMEERACEACECEAFGCEEELLVPVELR